MLLVRRCNSNIKHQVTCFRESVSCPLTQPKEYSTADHGNQWTTIYQFPYIRFVAALNKIKLYQFGITGTSLPATYALETSGYLTDTLPIVAAVGLSGSLTLIIISKLMSNIVGFLYVNKTLDTMKIAHVNFWGKRVNSEIPIESIVPISESPKQVFKFYITITNYINKSEFKLLHNYGIVDNEKFSRIFGD